MHRSSIIILKVFSEIFLGWTFLVSGCTIYLLFRSKSLNIYQWCSLVGFSDILDCLRLRVESWQITDFTRYSLPDGLYCASYILIIDAIWHKDNSLMKFIVISIVPIASIGNEVLQLLGLVKGTFDVFDFICYTVPSMIYFIYIYNSFKFHKLKSKAL